MNKSYLFIALVALSVISSPLYAQEKANQFTAKVGSSLEKYENAAKDLEGLKAPAEIREVSAKILKEYFGFTSVQFRSGNEHETRMAKFIAIHLKDILPANLESQSYVRVDRRSIYADDPERDFKLVPVNTVRNFILRLDSSVAGVDLKATVKDGKVVDDELRGGKTKERVETFTITVGGSRFLLSTRDLKAWMSMTINYGSLYYSVDFDIK